MLVSEEKLLISLGAALFSHTWFPFLLPVMLEGPEMGILVLSKISTRNFANTKKPRKLRSS